MKRVFGKSIVQFLSFAHYKALMIRFFYPTAFVRQQNFFGSLKIDGSQHFRGNCFEAISSFVPDAFWNC